MLKSVNKLVTRNKIPAAAVYSDFGVQQVNTINNNVVGWLKQQAFADSAPNPTYGEVEVKGDTYKFDSRKLDELSWDLRFEDQREEDINQDQPGEAFIRARVCGERFPILVSQNSAPKLSAGLNHFKIGVQNGESGWVKEGTFPKNVYLREELKDTGVSIEPSSWIQIPTYTDIRRDAKVGFRAAEDWARFRTMGLVAIEPTIAQLREEYQRTNGITDGYEKYNAQELMKSRIGQTLALVLGSIPDVRKGARGPTSLQTYYSPGVLETSLVLALEKGLLYSQQSKKEDVTPFFMICAHPVAIFSGHRRRREYDALFTYDVNSFGPIEEDETIRSAIEGNLQKYFDVDVKSPTNLTVRFHLSNARSLGEDIKKGNRDTRLHSEVAAFIDAMQGVYRANNSWPGNEDALRTNYELLVTENKRSHFGRLEQIFKGSPSIRACEREN
jgi:hypothetical protein